MTIQGGSKKKFLNSGILEKIALKAKLKKVFFAIKWVKQTNCFSPFKCPPIGSGWSDFNHQRAQPRFCAKENGCKNLLKSIQGLVAITSTLSLAQGKNCIRNKFVIF